MRFLEQFDCAYVINLPCRTDRQQEMQQELEKVGMPFAKGKVELFPAIRPDSPGPFASIGYRGAFLSHLQVLKHAKAQGLKNVLVMEDDLEFHPDFQQYEEGLLEELNSQDWDLVHFGYCTAQHEPSPIATRPLLQPCTQEIIGSQFYAVNGPAIDPLINFFEAVLQRPAGHPQGSPMSPDGVLNIFQQQHPQAKRLIAVSNFGDQRSSRSDISPQWFDRLALLRSLASWVRRTGLATSFSWLWRVGVAR